MKYSPPFKINQKILDLLNKISHALGVLEGAKLNFTPLSLRKENKIKTIQSTLAIEGNTLNLEQVSSILDGKRILAPKKDLIEVKNAIKLYNDLNSINPLSFKDLLNSHYILMKDLIEDNGKLRLGNVGIMKGSEISHIAPPADKIEFFLKDLFIFLNEDESSWILKSCIFHYEFEFIHPFNDGNGRIGRLWQHLLLMKESEVFEYISIEHLVKYNQQEYYKVLNLCDELGESTLFIEFICKLILDALNSHIDDLTNKAITYENRLNFALEKFKNNEFSRKDYILLIKNISTATASRDLANAVKQKKLIKIGENNNTKYKFF